MQRLFQILRGPEVSGKKLWKANVPGKVKQFLWKACTNALPKMENLKKRRILDDDTCHQCSSKAESGLQALWDCEGLRQLWDVDFNWINRHHASNGTFENLVEIVLEKLHLLELFVVLSWFLWSRRNKLRLKEEIIPLNRVVFEAKRFLSLHKPIRMIKPKLSKPTGAKWRPPV